MESGGIALPGSTAYPALVSVAQTGARRERAAGGLTLARLPSILLRLEGAAVFGASIALYIHLDFSALAFVLLALAPDLSMLGWLAGPRVGAATYDAVHTEVLPIVIATLGVLTGASVLTEVGLIWLAHIGFDRMIGAGLKYPTRFDDTHLDRV